MKHYLLEGIIDERCLRDFIAFCNQYDEEQKVVFLDSDGGATSYGMAIANIINTSHELFTVIAINSIKSCAAELFLMCICRRIVQPGTTAMLHASGREVRVLNSGIIASELERFEVEQLNKNIDRQLNFWAKYGLTESELTDFKMGKDVLIPYLRLKEMADNGQHP